MDAAQWHQEIGLVTSSSAAATAGAVAASSAACATVARPPATERRARPQKEQALNCPRCNSTNTKFCYYNNYSLTQPRYFCKTCRRYWTEGGSLRNVPVGGGSRKNKRSSLSTTIAAATATAAASSITATSSLTAKKLHGGGDLLPPPKFHDGQDLNLGFPQPTGLPEFSESSTTALSAMELLRSTARGIGPPPPFLPLQLSEYPSGFGMQEFRAAPTLNFTMEGLGGGSGSGGGVAPSAATVYGPLQGVRESSRMLFPFEEAKPVVHDATSTAASEFDQGGGSGHGRAQQGGDPPGFWSGMLGGSGGGGGSW